MKTYKKKQLLGQSLSEVKGSLSMKTYVNGSSSMKTHVNKGSRKPTRKAPTWIEALDENLRVLREWQLLNENLREWKLLDENLCER